MTFRERQEVALADLVTERAAATEFWWQLRLDQKIKEMRGAMFGEGK